MDKQEQKILIKSLKKQVKKLTKQVEEKEAQLRLMLAVGF